MNRTQIEWAKNPDGSQGYTWNPITGCLNHTDGLCKGGGFPCYAYKLAHTRLAERYTANKNTASPNPGQTNLCPEAISDPFYPRFWEERLRELAPSLFPCQQTRQGNIDMRHQESASSKGIFVCDMGDLFGMGIPEEWQRKILRTIELQPKHRFYILTKQAQRLPEWSPFPDNCWVGVTATTDAAYQAATFHLEQVKATVRFISFEPLLSPIDCYHAWDKRMERLIDWVIIGACTGTEKEMSYLAGRPRPFLTEMPWGNRWTAQPRIEWVQEIVEAADKAGIPVFLKDNLRPLLEEYPIPKGNMWAHKFVEGHFELRQEIPET